MSAPPLFILGSPRSFTSLVCAMLGQHPEAYGFPELNLFLAETVEEMLLTFSGYKQIQMHGLLRTLAQLYAGEQTLLALDMARRWIWVHRDWTTTQIYQELVRKISPLIGVDKSPAYATKREFLDRINAAFPDARYLHLTRNPLTQGKSLMAIADGVMAVLAGSIDFSTDPPTVDPQISWYEMQRTILDFLATIPPERQLRLRGEDVLSEPAVYLPRLCRWLGVCDDAQALDAMLHPEDSPFACLGPFGAHLGNDINFLRSPAYRPGKIASPTLDQPLPWRRDGAGFRAEVRALAHDLGYD
jgi:hypothetical protein